MKKPMSSNVQDRREDPAGATRFDDGFAPAIGDATFKAPMNGTQLSYEGDDYYLANGGVVGSAPFADTAAEDYRQLTDKRTEADATDWLLEQAGTPAEDGTAAAPGAAAAAPAAAAPAPGAKPVDAEGYSTDGSPTEITVGRPAKAAAPAGDEPLMRAIAGKIVQVGDAVGAGAVDVVKAITPTNLIPQIAGGGLDALNEMSKTIDDFGKFAEDNLGIPNLSVQLFDAKGKFQPAVFKSTAERAAAGSDVFQLPTTAEADTATGHFVRATSQFMAAFLPAASVVRAVGAGAVVTTAVASAISGAVAFDPHEERLSTYLNQVPSLSNLVPDYLADNDPKNESDWEGRLKNAIELGAVGVVTDVAVKGLLKAFKYYKLQRQAKRALAPPPPANEVADQSAKDAMKDAATKDLVAPVTPQDLSGLGSPDAPLVVAAAPDETHVRAFERINAASTRITLAGKLDGVNQALDEFRATKLGQSAEASGREPLDDLIDQVRSGPKALPKMQPKPAIGILRAAGGVRVGSPLAQELGRRGVNTRTAPGLFKKTGGLTDADNFPMSEHPIFADQAATVDGYIPQDTLLDAISDELSGRPWRTPEEQDLLDTIAGPVADMDRALTELGVDVTKMDNTAVKAALDAHVAEEGRLRELEKVAPVESADDYGAQDPNAPPPADSVSRETAKGRIFINHARIASAEDVKAVIQAVADSDAEAIGIAARGKVSNAATIKEARKAYTDLNDLIGRKAGPMSAAEAVAARKVLVASAEQLVALAERARLPGATPADLYALQRAKAVHYALQSQVIAARTETARALQSWAIPAGSDKMRADAIAELITADGGSGETLKFAQALASLKGNPTGVEALVRQSMAGKVKNALFEAWINGLLSSPMTHAVNITSNALTSIWAVPERMLAAGISKTFYGGEIQLGEAQAMAYGWARGARDGVALIARGSRAEGDDNLKNLFEAFGKVESTGTTRSISPTAFGVDPASVFGMGIDYLGRGVNIPSTLLRAEDTVFKAIGYRQELAALAYRKAASEGLEGRAFAERVQQVMADPPPDLHAAAMDFAHYQTYTNKLGKAANIGTAFLNHTPGGRIIVPFIKTPTNLLKYTFARTPLALASANVRADIRAGGARAAQAWARIGAGSMLMASIVDLTGEGVFSGNGPADPTMKASLMRTGWRPYSVKVGDRWYAYNRLDPIGMMVGLGADLHEVLAQTEGEEGEVLAGAAVIALTQNLANKTYMRGITDFISAMDPSNPMRSPGDYLANMTSGLVPFSSFLRANEHAVDPYVRDPTMTADDPFAQKYLGGLPAPVAEYLGSIINKARQDIPGLSTALPRRKDLWGEDVTNASGWGYAYDLMSPIASRLDKPSPIDTIIFDNGIRLTMPNRTIEGVKLSAAEYQQFVELAGKPAKAYLAQLIASPGFKSLSGGPDGMKAELIKSAINGFRDKARGQMIATNESLRKRALAAGQQKLKALEGAQ